MREQTDVHLFSNSLNCGCHAPNKHWMDRLEWLKQEETGREQNKNHDTQNEVNTQWPWKKARERSFLSSVLTASRSGSWAKHRILVQSYCIWRSGTLFVVKQDYFKEIPGYCNQFLILMETACYVVSTSWLLKPRWS